MNYGLNQLNSTMCQPIRLVGSQLKRLFNQASAVCFSLGALTRMVAVVLSLSLGLSLLAPAAPAAAQSAILTPRQVVEYALTLEKLEADFYRKAIAAATSGPLSSAPQVAKDALVSYGGDEAQHVTDLSAVLTALGGDPSAVVIPANPNYSAILGRDPFANPADLLLAGQYVEDLGVAAYKGQVQNLLAAGEAGKTVLAGALAIHSVEARHAAGIRFLRQTLLGANVRPWISSANSVIYNENRGSASASTQTKQNSNSGIPFSSEAFDGYATQEEVLALVQPILTTAQQPAPSQSPTPAPSPTSGSGSGVRALW